MKDFMNNMDNIQDIMKKIARNASKIKRLELETKLLEIRLLDMKCLGNDDVKQVEQVVKELAQ